VHRTFGGCTIRRGSNKYGMIQGRNYGKTTIQVGLMTSREKGGDEKWDQKKDRVEKDPKESRRQKACPETIPLNLMVGRSGPGAKKN